MDQTIDDLNDAHWDQAQGEERAKMEQSMLASDPGYGDWLQQFYIHSEVF
jgi:hypothetical protein